MACQNSKNSGRIVRVWPCLMHPEQTSCWRVMMEKRAPVSGAAPPCQVSFIDGLFAAITDGSAAKRLALWKTVWSITTTTVRKGGVDYFIYTTTAAWTVNLNDCRIAGCCADGDSICPETLHPAFADP